VIAACREELRGLGEHWAAERVRSVSEISDELGYDVVAPRLDGRLRRLEVKTTRSAAEIATVFVTRNELETGVADPNWQLVVVRSHRDRGHTILGHVGGEELAASMPEDRGEVGRWQVARVRMRVADLAPGLPPAAA
jgi:hypothetical protein